MRFSPASMTFLTGRRFEDYLTQSFASESRSHSKSRAHVDVGGTPARTAKISTLPVGQILARGQVPTRFLSSLPGMSQNCHSSSWNVSYSPLGLYMFITEQEAADIYARACRHWYGDEASR